VSGVVNDSVGKTNIAVLYEAGTSTCAAVSRELDGSVLTFEFRSDSREKPGFYDTETGSRWTIEGLAVEGPLKGKHLVRAAGTLSEWYGWAAFYPQTSIYSDGPAPAKQVRK